MAGTRWVKLDTSYLRNPKITALSERAVLLHLASICFCADQVTDGIISKTDLKQIANMAHISPYWHKRTATELVQGGLWDVNGNGGWHLHDFEVMNPQAMRHAVEAERKRWRERQARHRG